MTYVTSLLFFISMGLGSGLSLSGTKGIRGTGGDRGCLADCLCCKKLAGMHRAYKDC